MTQLRPDLTEPRTAADAPGPDFVEADLRSVERELEDFLAARERDAEPYGEEYVRLWLAVGESARGGKRLRPRLVLSAFHGLSGGHRTADAATRRAAVQTALAFELLHSAFLLHDDVIDGDTVRRGRPNVAGEFSADALFRGAGFSRARLWGESAAILAGDLLLHAAAQRVARLTVPEATRSRLLDLIDRAVFVTAAGELADVGLATGMSASALPDVLSMTADKTAEYSVSGPLAAGALLAGADDAVVELLARYGRLVGVAFQLGDDLLGVYGDESVTGKSAVGDLQQGKETTLIAFARGTSHWADIEPLFGRTDLSAADTARLAAALEGCGARDFAERLLADHVDAAIDALDSPLLPSALADTLTRVALGCVGRAA
ncbi:polyprenyl synthetase family protein [Leifsonia shinshuensis]|uniref:Geranylgeranyl diphosphate synthase type II n=1 Tax=Leifsonia shinshuensis TaxID=150026 RepID=A0A853CTG9_9MICO|nr:polyprenyl synthetase family protein [Leifsonia shinshuensis]NYJ23678.1 geranylgeranyl diphosphate synthase type II [Leifsonia shinshuensis]